MAQLKLEGAKIGQWCPSRRAMEVDFQVARALMGGTTAMRSMGVVFLPPDERERDLPLDYNQRLLRTFLTEAYGDGVKNLAAKPFQRPVKLDNADLLPNELQPIEHDADRRGMSLTQFSQQAFEAGIDRGIVHILVDHPPVGQVPTGEFDVQGAPIMRDRTGGDDIKDDIRPYFTIVSADNLIGWAWTRDASDHDVLSYVAIYESRDVMDPQTTEIRSVEQVKFWTDSEWQLWEREAPVVRTGSTTLKADIDLIQTARQASLQSQANEQRPYFLVRSGTHPLGMVPLVSINLAPYGSDRLEARPALKSLMWANLEHWQVSSWRGSVMFYSGSPILVVANASPEQTDDDGTSAKPIKVGAGATLVSKGPLDVSYAEPAGSSSLTLKERDTELREQMQALALAPLMRATGANAPTATGSAIDEKQSTCRAQSWVEKFEWGLYKAYVIAQKWVDPAADLPDEFDLAVFRDFSMGSRTESEMRMIDAARGRGDLSRETYLSELIERGVLTTIDDVQDEIARIAEEGPDLSSVLPFGVPQPTMPDGMSNGDGAAMDRMMGDAAGSSGRN
jgi:Domain of unknown function (DUF4055)